MLIIDGVKFNLHVPKSEKEFENLVKEHITEIFGKDSLYFDIKPELRSKAGIGSKPDGIAIRLDEPSFYIVEFELASHPVYDHVIAQINRFNTAFKSSETKLKMAEAIYSEISSDPFKNMLVKSKKDEPFKFLTEVFSSKPKLVIIVNKASDELREAVENLPFESKVVEFKTFERENVGISVHAHLFEPIVPSEIMKIEKKRPPILPPSRKDRLELWCRIYNEGGIVTRDRLHEIWVKVMGKDARGLGGFFTGKASLAKTTDGKVTLTDIAKDKVKKWTGNDYR